MIWATYARLHRQSKWSSLLWTVMSYLFSWRGYWWSRDADWSHSSPLYLPFLPSSGREKMAAWHEGRHGSTTSNLLMPVSRHREPDVEQRGATEERSLRDFIVLRIKHGAGWTCLRWIQTDATCRKKKKKQSVLCFKQSRDDNSFLHRSSSSIWGQSWPESTQHSSHRARKISKGKY